jgi:hypothetical protein
MLNDAVRQDKKSFITFASITAGQVALIREGKCRDVRWLETFGILVDCGMIEGRRTDDEDMAEEEHEDFVLFGFYAGLILEAVRLPHNDPGEAALWAELYRHAIKQNYEQAWDNAKSLSREVDLTELVCPSLEELFELAASRVDMLCRCLGVSTRWLGLYGVFVRAGYVSARRRGFVSSAFLHRDYELRFALSAIGRGDKDGALKALKRAERYQSLLEQRPQTAHNS